MRAGRLRARVTACSLAMWLAASIGHGEGLAAAQWKGVAPNGSNTFRFVVVSDNTGGFVPGELEDAVREINLLKPDFVISVGDFIEGYITDTNELAAMWDVFDAKIGKLDAPFFYCAGNHDLSNPVMGKMWTERYGVGGKTYFSFDYRGSHFVVLDAVTPMYLDDKTFSSDFMKEQLAWLAKDLAAAEKTQHVFVFYHPPLVLTGWNDAWRELVKLLPAGKTTVFNGHLHQLSYSAPDGIPTYTLGATGSRSVGGEEGDVSNRELGLFRMFAHVAVDYGTPSIAMIPVHEVLPADVVLRDFSIAFLQKTWYRQQPVSSKGGTVSLTYHNDLGAPFRVAASWEAPDWGVTPPSAETNIPPGRLGALSFELKPRGGHPEFPSYRLAFESTDPAGRKVSYRVKHTVTFPAEFDIPAVQGVAVDGELSDWKNVTPFAMRQKSRICVGAENWKGEADSSTLVYLGHDAERLYVCMDVTDDQLANDDKYCWGNDGVEFYWDSRPADKQNGQHGVGTGQVILALPAEGQNPVPFWNMGDRAIPQGLATAVSRTSGGYICEFSVPFQELGVNTPVTVGQTVRLEFMVNDRDVEDGSPAQTHMTTSGQSGAAATTYYAGCTCL